jgi:hypothetical protein
MGSVADQLGISGVWADAVFASALQRCEHPSAGEVRRAAAAAVGAFGPCGCAARVAQEFGDHPETAVTRMRWARTVAAEAFRDELAGWEDADPVSCPVAAR